MTSCVWQNL